MAAKSSDMMDHPLVEKEVSKSEQKKSNPACMHSVASL